MKNFLYPLSLAAVLCTGLQSASAAEFPDTDSDATTATGNRLEDFFTAALNYSPRLAIARERWNIGTARKQAANGQLLPQVMASANLSDNDRTADREPTIKYDGERYLLQMTQVLFNWQAFEARRQAYLLEDQTEAEYYAELADLLTEVADLYLAVLQAEDALRSVDSELEAMTNQINQIQTLYDRQLVQITDLYAGEARLAAIGAQRVNLESELLLAREGLRAVSGVEAGDLYGLPEVIDITPLQGELDEWIARTAANNRLIEARGYALQAAEKRVSQQRGAYMPRVTLVLNRQRSNIGFENAPLPSEAETNYIGIDVTMPLFAGGSNRAAVREALSQRNIADSELRQIRLDMIQNTRLAWSQVKSGEALIAAGQVLAESTATSFTAMQRGFELGTVTSVDVLNALRDQFVSERDLQKARYDHIRATLMLRREAGALTPEDLMNISAMLVQ
jgi:outer membrane protein